MHLSIAAVGKLKRGAESELFDRYWKMAQKGGRNLGFKSFKLIEYSESRAGSSQERKVAEAAGIVQGLNSGSILVCLDECGDNLSSRQLAHWIAAERDGGTQSMIFAIGGPDGHGEEIKSRASKIISLGRLTWPHGLIRVMLAEQLYRSMTLLSGHPYHRD